MLLKLAQPFSLVKCPLKEGRITLPKKERRIETAMATNLAAALPPIPLDFTMTYPPNQWYSHKVGALSGPFFVVAIVCVLPHNNVHSTASVEEARVVRDAPDGFRMPRARTWHRGIGDSGGD